MLEHLHWIDITIIFGYLIGCLVIGYSRANKINSLTEYAIGSRTITAFALMTAVFATKIGAGATMGEIERVYSLGLFFAVSLLLSPFFWFITAKIFYGNIDKFRDCITLTDIMRKLYGKPGQWFTVFASLVDSLGSVSAQLSAIGFLFQYLLNLPGYWGIILAGCLVCAYVIFGGAKSVVLTDTFQFIIFYAAMPIACVIAVKSSGGVDNIIAKIPDSLLEFDLSGNNKWVFLTFCFYALLPATSATFIQRFLMSRNSEQLGYSLNSVALIAFPFAAILCVIGFTIRATAPEVEPNSAFYHLIINYLPSGVVGLSIAAVLAIIMSSANSWLNSGATIIANDVLRTFYPKMTDKQGLFYARVATVGITAGSIVIAMIGGSIMNIIWFTDSYWFPVMLIPITAGMFGFRTSVLTFSISATSAIITVTCIVLHQGEYNTLSICGGIAASFITFFLHHYMFNVGLFSQSKSIAGTLLKLLTRLASLLSPTRIVDALAKCDSSNRSTYMMLCIFLLYQYIPSMLDSAISQNVEFVPMVYLKIFVIAFAFILISISPQSRFYNNKFMSILWQINLLLALCYTPALMLIVNSYKTIWIINMLLCLTMLIVLMPARACINFMVVGFVLAYLSADIFTVKDNVEIVAYSFITNSLPAAYGVIGVVLIFIIKQGTEKRQQILQSNASFVAHEAISPLAAVNMTAETFNMIIQKYQRSEDSKNIELKVEDWNALRELVSNLSKSSEGGIKRINTILNSKHGKYNDVGCYQIVDIIQDLLLEEFLAYQHKISFTYESNFVFYGSCEALKSAISNLLRNAIKHAGESAMIQVHIDAKNNITVKDDGIGMNRELKNSIFNEKTTTSGHGYGLSICKKIIEDHGGSITCASKPGEGTTFTINLV